jgi:hypothetical protein
VPRFDFLTFHPAFEDHQHEAGRPVITMEEALDAWYGERLVVRNRKGRRGPYLMIGSTGSGRDITVVLLATAEEGTWLAYTAWDTKWSDR